MKDIRASLHVSREFRDSLMRAKPYGMSLEVWLGLLLVDWRDKVKRMNKTADEALMPCGPVRIEGDAGMVRYNALFSGPDTEEDRSVLGKVTGNRMGRPKGSKDTKPRKPYQKRLIKVEVEREKATIKQS